ncbi:uncharacterized membrane protein YcaP (DUF421 family) [Geomicrobium halophilum]|uniref:Uncharacterized membrane protein YcaP (DUF421 family) n=1 Tax=Geomicrobium halophilum TaxID=549000 RepID=A0A841PSC9_9BACL|nr:DUF421 domain-containing protein [Geomicrobium halophilum]MBB6449201.1 uncharacterized membrane protein YcaP (DUF421 family) [Geomicrobium halophilum]
MQFITDIWTGAEQLPIYGFLVRALVVYVYIFIMVKIIGQRSMANIDPLDFIFGIVIGDILGETVSSGDTDIGGPFAGAAVIAFMHWFLTYVGLKLPLFRRVIENEPFIIIEKGQILDDMLKKCNVTIEQLLMELRQNDASNLNEIDYAVLEPNGQVSVIKKAPYNAATAQDIGLNPQNTGYPSVIIADGQLISKNMKKIMTRQELEKGLKAQGYTSIEDIFLLTVNNAGEWYLSPRLRV